MKYTIKIKDNEVFEVELKVRDRRNLNATTKAKNQLLTFLRDMTINKNEIMLLRGLLEDMANGGDYTTFKHIYQ